MKNESRNGIVNALIYLMVFVLVQLITTYVVCIVWGLAEGKPVSQSLAAIGTGNTSIPQLIVIQSVFSLIVMVIFLWRRWATVSRTYLRTWR